MNGQHRVVRNIIALLVNQLGTWIVTFALTLVVPSYLGLHIFGLYSFVGTFVGFFSLGMNLGTGTYLTWRIAREPQEAGKLTFNTLMLQLPLGVACGVLVVTLMPLFDKHPDVMTLTLLVLFSALLSALTSTCVAAMSGLQRMRTPATLNVIGSALGAALILLCVHLNAGVLSIAAVGVISQLVTFTATLLYTQVRIKMHPQLNVRLWPKIIAGGMPFFLWSVVLIWYWQIDVPLLKILCGVHGDEAVGWYAAANKIIGIPVFLPNIVVTALLPALSRERSADSPTFRALASRAIRLVAAVNIPAAVGMTMLANSLTSLLHYPPAFDRVAPLIVILSWNMPLVAVDMVLGTVLVALGRQKQWTFVGVIAAVLNPLVNLWAIPYAQHVWGNGAIAASLTTIMSELIMLGGAIYLCPKTIFSKGDVFYIVRCFMAAALMVPAIWGLSSQQNVGVLTAVAYGLVLYAMAAYTLQIVRNDDLSKLLTAVSTKAGIAPSEDLRGLLRDAGRPLAFAGTVISRPLSRVGTVVSQPLGRARRRITGALAHASSNMHAERFTLFTALHAHVPSPSNTDEHTGNVYGWSTPASPSYTMTADANDSAERATAAVADDELAPVMDRVAPTPLPSEVVTAPLPLGRRAIIRARSMPDMQRRSDARPLLRRQEQHARVRLPFGEGGGEVVMTVWQLIREDLCAWKRIGFLGEQAKHSRLRLSEVIKLYWRFPGVRASVIYRLSHEADRRHVRLLPMLLTHHNVRHYGFDVVPSIPIGPGLYVPHPVGTVIMARSIGCNCHIVSAVTIGMRNRYAFPTIGDDVTIGCGARVLGAITIGNDVNIGANAVVIDDIPDGATAVGIPARIIRKQTLPDSMPAGSECSESRVMPIRVNEDALTR